MHVEGLVVENLLAMIVLSR